MIENNDGINNENDGGNNNNNNNNNGDSNGANNQGGNGNESGSNNEGGNDNSNSNSNANDSNISNNDGNTNGSGDSSGDVIETGGETVEKTASNQCGKSSEAKEYWKQFSLESACTAEGGVWRWGCRGWNSATRKCAINEKSCFPPKCRR